MIAYKSISGLITEDFETNGLAGGGIRCPNPLNSSSDNACFHPGDLLANVNYTLPDSADGTFLALSPAVDTVTDRIGADNLNDFLVIQFSDPNTTAVGLDLICTSAERAGTVRFYSANGLITEEAVSCTKGGNFIGISGDELIIRVEAQAPGTWEAVDNVTFGSATLFTAYSDRDEFEVTYPLLNKEDFESGHLNDGSGRTCPSPLDASSDNLCFSPGDLVAGVQYQVQGTSVTNELTLGDPIQGRSITLGPNTASDFLIASFSGSQTTGVGLDVYCVLSDGIASVRFYSTKGLITEQSFDCSKSAAFIGIAANKHITLIEAEFVGNFEYIDNLLFGRAALELVFNDGFE